jgi:hypothetical protein
MTVEKILHNQDILALILRDSDWGEGLTFLSQDSDYLQVGTWGYNEGKKLNAHIHLTEHRTVLFTQEVLLIKKGSVRVYIYSRDEKLIHTTDLFEGDVIVLLRGGHGYEILQDGTKVLEVKNGPYVGTTKDRRVIENPKTEG